MPISFYIYKAQLRNKKARDCEQGHTALGRAVSRRYMYEIGVYTIFWPGAFFYSFPRKDSHLHFKRIRILFCYLQMFLF